jgi:PKD repeat protein
MESLIIQHEVQPIYAEAGTYNVTLTVTDNNAIDPKTDTVTKEVTVATEE